MLETQQAVQSPPELVELLDRLRILLAQGEVEDARRLAVQAAKQWPEDAAARHWARVLAPPRVVGTRPATGRSLEREYRWLGEHSREHPGCWLAVDGDQLLAVDRDLDRVLDTLRQLGDASDPLLHYEPELAA